MKSLTSLAVLLLVGGVHAQIAPMTATPDEVVVDVISGHGPQGGPDAKITVLTGPNGTGFAGAFQPRHFAAARNGPPAYVMTAPPSPSQIQALTTNDDAWWISPNQASQGGGSTVAGLFAIEFDVPQVPTLKAKLDLTFSADDYVGFGPNNGVWLNEKPVPGTGQFINLFQQSSWADLDVTGLLRPGTNRLYFYLVNTGGPAGLLFHARFRVNSTPPDECASAFPAGLGANPGSTVGFGTSAEAAACGFSNDRWYWYVPPFSGQFTATLTGSGSHFAPALGVYTGSCGALTQVACATGPASWTGAVPAGTPILLSVGSANGGAGTFGLDLQLDPPPNGMIYPGNGHLYTVGPTIVDIVGARAYATSQGGYLAAINDAAESAWIQSVIAPGESVWIGLSDEVTEGTWLWDSGEPFGAHASWSPGEPNDFPTCLGEDYVEMRTDGNWNDLNTGPNPCGDHSRRPLVEIPTTGLAFVTDLGGGCGPPGTDPTLWSEPHVLGTTVDMAVLEAGPGSTILLNRSAAGGFATSVGDCIVHLDAGTTTLVQAAITNAYGSASFPFAVPASPALVGTQEVWQAQVIPPSAGVSYTNALESTLGN